ncbi:hypothetical protein [Alteraurantiacibacter aquimixticola]|uniref:DUF2029 domain-containing protein n=1 Tax=Alteraurantiacibacter aquimixticola TaxID=2489173 RepID=A0A4T3F5Y9_9SPHN|nr:hypothetical protein [Alteraurantiacibacter aquimixticola]TIX51052.1 hypothetical protein E5222_00770 [Alteraurantiacibacter aquimixticola]
MGINARRLPWDRFAHWAPGAAMLVMAFTAVLLVAAVLTERTGFSEPDSVPFPSTELVEEMVDAELGDDDDRDTDLALYDRIAERVAAGEDYYAAAVAEQRAGDFPVRPGTTVRLPTLAYLNAWIGQGGLAVLAVLVGLATLIAWWRRLDDEPGGEEHRNIAMLLLVIGAGIGLKAEYLVLHEVWAGVLLALSFGVHRPGKWGLAWLAAAAALAIREHALPFVLLMGAFALFRRDWRELAAWTGLVLVFAVVWAAHLAQVDALISEADPRSPAWLVLRGLGGWTLNITESSVLHLVPGWLAAPLVLLPLLGWAGWKSDAGLFGFLLFLGYGVFFMLAGRDNNFYWALVVTPCWFMGYAFVPRALRSLWNSARGR